MNNLTTKPKYRPEIEGLRGIAILAVVFFHSKIKFTSGGYIGVDVFFVLSGFLITLSIKNSIENNTFSILKFYKKRILRILPASLTVLIIAGAIGLWILFPEELNELSENIYYFLTFRANSWAKNSINYFGIAVEYKPLIHYWTLSIELQFYLIFPLIFNYFFSRQKHSLLRLICFFIFLSSFIYAATTVGNSSINGYFSTLMRLWEFMFGVNLFLYSGMQYTKSVKLRIQNYFTGIGIFLVIISVFIFNPRSDFPGSAALIPCSGTALVLAFGNKKTFFNKCLSTPALSFFGRISFSLYLIHQPVFAFYRIWQGRGTNPLECFLLIILSIILSTILWVTIEKPAQKKNQQFAIVKNFSFSALFIFVLIFSYKGTKQDLPQFITETNVEKYLKYRYDNNPKVKECRNVTDPSKACIYGDPELPRVVLWGDSHADQIIVPLSQEFEKYGYSTMEFVMTGCPPILNVSKANGGGGCGKYSSRILEFIKNNYEIKHVFLFSYWTGYIDDHLIVPDRNIKRISEIEFIKDSFGAVIKQLLISGKKVHIIYPVPRMRVDPPLFLARRELMYPGKAHPIITLTRKEFQMQSYNAIKLIDAIVDEFNIDAIHIAQYLFDEESSTYHANDSHSVFYRDDNHLSVTGAYKIAKPIALKVFGQLTDSFQSAEKIRSLSGS